MKVTFTGFCLISGMLACGICSSSVNAQVIPDGTLKTTVSQSGNNFTITNGNRVENNLFHSFSQFSVPTKGSAFFNNASDIQNIFSRVTGGNVSNIDGLIQANGSANLFLLNPSGIIFGQNASLNIGGSFVGTTANSIKFADGVEFSAVNPTQAPLLTMSVPVGLQMGSNAGAIAVQGAPANNFALRTSTLSISPNQTLALIGGQIDINSANIFAPDGHVELWAMQNGTVNIPTSGNWQLASSSPSPTWGNITLQQSSYINTSGATGGAINIRGRGLTLQNGSHIESSTYGANKQGQGINVQTTEFVDVLGLSHPDNYLFSGLGTNVSGSGSTAGNIQIDTQRLRVSTGAWISSITFGTNLFTSLSVTDSNTGQIIVHATDVEVQGYNPTPNTFGGHSVSAISTMITGGQRNNGSAIIIDADRVRVLDGARLSSDVIGPLIPPITPTIGNAGNIVVTARESLEIRGTNPDQFSSGISSSIQFLGVGEAGNIKINAGQLSLSNGGTITSAIAGNLIAANAGQGIAGDISIQANDVQVSDPIFDPFSQAISGITVAVGQNSTGKGGNINLTADSLRVFNGGQITSSTDGKAAAGNVSLQVNNITVEGISQPLADGRILPSAITAASTTTSDAGSVNLVADQLNVLDHGQISVSNTGGGNSGNLLVNANQIKLAQGGSLLSQVSAGNRGNITLNTGVLLMRYGSKINTNATGTAIGGNISINAPIIVGLENSNITANAIEGAGGNIEITTQGIFGLQFRDHETPESDITASSQFGVSGTVNINNFGVDPDSGLIKLPENITDPSQQIATGCADTSDSNFLYTRRGGISQNPSQDIINHRTWSDIRDLSAYRKNSSITAQIPKSPESLVQATSWYRNAQGKIELVADTSSTQVQQALTCAAIPQN